jgi:2-amino-4-hydroxy-6-hydroxymethyldihydropteridine diphosphokinase
MGDRVEYMQRAVHELELRGVYIQQMSSIIETEPVGGPAQGKYLNAVVEGVTILSPAELLETIREVESLLGRVRSVKNAPRTIDVDILLYDQLHMNAPTLTIPHPRMFTRDFVLIPLKEIAPHLFKEKR